MDEQQSSDYHNFTQTQTQAHRLPTVNGAQVLFGEHEGMKVVSTGLLELDDALASRTADCSASRGIPRGRLTEIYGPPGAGKTHLGMQLVVNALIEDKEACAVWIDTTSELCWDRLHDFVSKRADSTENSEQVAAATVSSSNADNFPERLRHFHISSLPHLLSVIVSPDLEFIPEKTSIVIFDDLSDVILTGLPQSLKFTEPTTNGLSRDEIVSKSVASRRSALISALSSNLARLAAARDIAVVALNKTSSYRKTGVRGSILRPALNVPQWNENVATRIAVCRDFWPQIDWATLDRSERNKLRKRERWPLRIMGADRVNGRDKRIEWKRFVILKDCLRGIDGQQTTTVPMSTALPSSPRIHDDDDNQEAMGKLGIGDVVEIIDLSTQMPSHRSPSPAPSRKRTIDEVADSEDDDEEVHEARRNDHKQMQTAKAQQNGGFIPSSQLQQEGLGDDHKDTRPDSEGQDENHVDEMLLKE